MLALMIKREMFTQWAEQQTDSILLELLNDNDRDKKEAIKVRPIVEAYIIKRLERSKQLDENSDFAEDIIDGAREKCINASYTPG
jgi:hypothetical protein